MQVLFAESNNLSPEGKLKLEKLVQEDIGFSRLEEPNQVVVVQKGLETLDMYEEEKEGVSFFHEIENATWHVRVQTT
jgi:hypothetical protein